MTPSEPPLLQAILSVAPVLQSRVFLLVCYGEHVLTNKS